MAASGDHLEKGDEVTVHDQNKKDEDANANTTTATTPTTWIDTMLLLLQWLVIWIGAHALFQLLAYQALQFGSPYFFGHEVGGGHGPLGLTLKENFVMQGTAVAGANGSWKLYKRFRGLG